MLKHCLAMGLTFICYLPGIGLASDRLNQTALQQKEAHKSVLLSITQVGDALVAVGEQGTIVRSNDNAKSWQQMSVPVSTLLTRVRFANATQGWAVGHDGVVLSSLDGGKSWLKQLDGEQINELVIAALKQQYLSLEQQLAMDDQALAALQLERDALEEAFENLEYSLEDADIAKEEGATIPLLDIAIVNSKTVFIAGAYGLLLKTQDAGKSWAYLGNVIPNPEKFHINRFLIADNGHYYIAGESGLLIESQDQGQTWAEMESPYSGSWYNLIDGANLYVMGLRGHLYRLEARSWQKVEMKQTATINDALWFENQLILIGNAGLLLKLSDNKVSQINGENVSYSEALINKNRLILVGENGLSEVSLVVGSK